MTVILSGVRPGQPPVAVVLVRCDLPRDIERFWSKVDRRGPDECWPWLAGHFDTGYGSFRLDGRNRGAHRVAYELTKGPIPPGLFVCHTCDVRGCCNPAHLFEGTQSANILDASRKGRHANQWTGRGTCKWGHALEGSNVAVWGRARPQRVCLTCRRDRRLRERRAARMSPQ